MGPNTSASHVVAFALMCQPRRRMYHATIVCNEGPKTWIHRPSSLGYDALPLENPESNGLSPTISDAERALATVSGHYVATLLFAGLLLKWGAIHHTGEVVFAGIDQVGMGMLAGALMFGNSTRYGLLNERLAIAAAPWVLVVGAFWVHILELGQPTSANPSVIGISWSCIWIIGYGQEGPRLPPWWPSLLAAATGPAAFGCLWLLGLTAPIEMGKAVLLFAPQIVCALAVGVPLEELVTQQADDRMGNYRVLDKLGHGGMGEVWRAEHRTLGTPAAIKLIAHASSGTSVDREHLEERFKREARAMSDLKSPHTVRLFDYGITLDRRYFYVMERLDGLDLRSLVERFGPIPQERVIAILKQALLSLAEAHGAGLVHRDIKPANLVICRLGVEVDFVKVLDFGLVSLAQVDAAKIDPAQPPEDARLTVEGSITGTPAFISPEAVTGALVDHRADIYSLGCVAVWLLTGELLFTGTAQEIVVAHAVEDPVLPSKRTELAVDPDFEAVIGSCLAKDPNERPTDAAALYDMLSACEAQGDWTLRRAVDWWDKHLPVG